MPETDPAEQEAVSVAALLDSRDEEAKLTTPEIEESGNVHEKPLALEEQEKPLALEDFVGTWVYKDKYRYVISLTRYRQVEYRETLSGGQALVGILHKRFSDSLGESQFRPPARKAALAAVAEMTNGEGGKPQGSMRFWLTKEGVIRSNFKKVGSAAEWGKDIMAKRASPMKWNEDSTQDDEWFEVLDTVVVSKEPSLDSAISASRWGTLSKGQKVTVSCIRSICPRGIVFAELTRDELESNFGWDGSCGVSARGFAAVDASKVSSPNLLMKGPLEKHECPDAPTKSTWRIADMQADEYEVTVEGRPNPVSVLGFSDADVGRPFLPSVPERTIAVARSIVQNGWAYIGQVGVHTTILRQVRKEIMRMQADMTPGQKNTLDFSYRSDKRIFFDTEAGLRKDIPGLNQLAQTLQNLVEQLGKVLARSPLRMRITGHCRPMLACYGRSAFYLPHVDNANGDGRVLTLVYYLNREWGPEHGGRLRLYPNAERRQLITGVPMDGCVEIVPREDSLAIFQADWMVHEVTPAEDERFALTLWFNGEHDKS